MNDLTKPTIMARKLENSFLVLSVNIGKTLLCMMLLAFSPSWTGLQSHFMEE